MHRTEHLYLNKKGSLWRDLWLFGSIEESPQWPPFFGPEPKWFRAEVAEMLEVWKQSERTVEAS